MPTPPPVRWDPRDYAASSSSQAHWGQDLLNTIQWHGNEHVLDVGCGDGRLTAALASCVPHGRVLGIDSSAEMITHARAAYPPSTHPNLSFRQMDACAINLTREYDVLFSNAALHWVNDHPAFLRCAASVLRTGGRLLVSCGGQGNADEVFQALRAEMRSPAWRRFFRNLEKPYFFHSDAAYHAWLPDAGFQPVTVRLVPKDAAHENVAAFAGWFRTTWMPYTQRVPAADRARFIEAVVARYLANHPAKADGTVRVAMVRLELDAIRI
jgi:trans-aconitate methyltransferase